VLAGASVAVNGSPAFADQIRDDQWHLEFLKVAEAHRFSTGKGITVAVIDSGVSIHSDLAGSVLSGTDLIKRGGNGRIDLTGHGSGMAGLIAAHGRNGDGALGVAPGSRILPIRALNTEHGAVDYRTAVRFAISHGAKVINISIGGPVSPERLAVFQEASRSDVVVVASAGNRPESVGISAPAFLDSVVAVGAVDKSGKRASVSVTGKALDLVAPGVNMTSTNNKGGYREGTGTSDAAAIVSGAAALIRSKYPKMTAAEVVELLESTATDAGAPGVDEEYGHGIVNIVAALQAGPGSGAGASSAPSTPTTTAPSNSPAPAAHPQRAEAEPASSNGPLVVGLGAVVILISGLTAFLVLRRRTPTP
jgi:type VII secretion-associated serine protease mycosin